MTAPLIVHIVHRFDFGGLENGLVNLVNHMDVGVARHAIVAMTEATEIRSRIVRRDVAVHALHKRLGQDPAAYVRLYRLLKQLRPDVVHTRNFGTLDCQLVAWLAGVPCRIHGEHGWDVYDPDGTHPKYRLVRRAVAPFVHRFVALSGELERWLVDALHIDPRRVVRICNGVDAARFTPQPHAAAAGTLTLGSVTRFSEIKDPLNTLSAFEALARTFPQARLVMVGDGPLLDAARSRAQAAGIAASVCLPGAALDVAPWLARMDVFVLGSRREGISNTVLEAMAAGLPVVATDVGGNGELVEHGVTGFLVPPQSPDALASALSNYLADPELARRHGAAGRRRIEAHFSIDAMVARYAGLYRDALADVGRRAATPVESIHPRA